MTTLLFGRATIIGRMRYFFLNRYYSQTVRIFFIGLALLFTLISTFLFRDVNSGGIIKGFVPIIILLGIIAFLLVYSNLQLPAILILVTSMLISDGIATGTGTKITFTFLILHIWAAVWLIKLLVVDRQIKVRWSSANIPALIFMAVSTISFIWAWVYVDANVGSLYGSKFFPRLMALLIFIISPTTYIMYANHIRSMRTLRFIVWWFIIIAGLFAFLHFTLKGDFPAIFNAKGQFPTWVAAFCLGQLFFNSKLRWYTRAFLILITVAWFYIILGLGLTWLSGWLPMLLVFFLIMFFYSRKVFLLLIFLAVVYMLANPAFVDSTFNHEEDESGGTRAAAWEAALSLTHDHLLFGTGPAGYAYYYATNGFKANFSHNNYVDIITETGLVGFSSFILFWLAQGWMVVKMYRTVKGNDFAVGAKYALVAAYPATILSMMLGDWVTPFIYTQTLAGVDYAIWAWIVAGMTVALYHIYLEQGHQETDVVLADSR